ncbi:MAG: nucleoside kinase [Muribaculaceae bacterium]|nr:nucleoside kinase [Muribaculaceae bacterium]
MPKKNIQIYCVNTVRHLSTEGGETLAEIAGRLGDALGLEPICARVNNKSEDLGYAIYSPKQVEFVGLASPLGRRVYTRSLCMMLYRAASLELEGCSLKIEHSISRGHFCRLSRDGKLVEITPELLERLTARLTAMHREDIPFVRHQQLTEEVKQLFRREGLEEKVSLLDTEADLYTAYYTLADTADSYYGPLAPSTRYVGVFALHPYHDGFLLMGPDPSDLSRPQEPQPQEKLYKAFTDYLKFNRVIRVSTVGELNKAVLANKTPDLINVAEAMHDKYLGRISDDIAARNREGGARVVMLAGPSSSGKTTTNKRLAIQLMTNLLVPRLISMDDYFIDREHTPRDEKGDYDFEHLHALDLDRFNSDLRRLLAGETINLPTYSFELGRRVEKHRPLSLGPKDVLLIEGIHGLNPELTHALRGDDVYKIYVSALTTLCIDDHNWISTNDNRLLRRIVRDHKYRHISALDTLRRWPSVQRGEERWIFPFQENADALFNSSLIFEIGVMKPYAEPLLHSVAHNVEQYAEAYRLLKLLSYFVPIEARQIPTTSLLREFLGGSSFTY